MRGIRCVGLAVAVVSGLGLTASAASAKHAGAATSSATTRIVRLGPGRAQGTASLREPSGVILLAQISAARGIRAAVELTNADYAGPGVADITLATAPTKRDPSPSCRAHRGEEVCTQAIEWCPMTAARWRLNVTKQNGPATQVRIDFIIGPKPTSRA
jgi:hypothetical protein